MRSIERQLQICLNKLEAWANENGFKFSTSKTVCVHFCRQRGLHPDPELTLYGAPIPVVTQVKFLGIIFDNKLTFEPHIKQLKQKCQKALTLLRVISHMDWGGDRETLLRLYKSLILSKLDYGCFVYGSAAKSHLAKLDPIQNEGLRLCLGAYKTSNAESLGVEANIPPLGLRREQLALQYTLKLKANPTNPTYKLVFNPPCAVQFSQKQKTIAPFGIRIQESVRHIEIDLERIATAVLPKTPPWTYESFIVNWELAKYPKSDTTPSVYKAEFKRISEYLYNDCEFIYTDGSKQGQKVGCAAVSSFGTSIKQKLPNYGSIFTAELSAIDLALEIIEDRAGVNKKFVICSDSQSSLQALQNNDYTNPILTNVRERINMLTSNFGITINFLWTRGHVQIKGNETADRLAKESLDLEGESNDKLPFSDLKCLVKPYTREKWQYYWAMPKPRPNKLFEIQPVLGLWPNASRRSRREEIVLARLRIGHTHLTNSYLRKGEEQPFCISCDCSFTIKHILLDCIEYSHIRTKYYNVTTMSDLFQTVRPDLILEFLKEAQLFYKI
jgi:ribonuclease HI